MKEKDCEKCDGRCQVPVDEAVEKGGTKMRPIIRVIRAFLAGFLCVGILVVIAFLIVVDIIDGISRHEDRRQTKDVIVQDLPSPKLSEGD
jgi:hypothetical protein